MASIKERKRPNGKPSVFVGSVQINENGITVYNKSKTFTKRKLANEWAVVKEAEVRKNRPWAKVKKSGLLIPTGYAALIPYTPEMTIPRVTTIVL